MGNGAFSDYLLGLLADSARKLDKNTFRFTRRAFLGGLAAAGAASAASATSFRTVPRFQWVGSTLWLYYGGRTWTIDRAAYGSSARLTLTKRPEHYIVRLSRAKLPGTDLRVDFALIVTRLRRSWVAKLRVPTLGVSGQVELARWMEGRPVKGRARSGAFSAGRTQVRARGGSVAVSAAEGLSFLFEGPVALEGQCEVRGEGLQLAPRRQLDDDWLAEDERRGWVTEFAVTRPVVAGRAFSCGTPESSATIRPTAVERLDGCFYEAAGDCRQFTRLHSPAIVELRHRGVSKGRLRLNRAVTAIDHGRLGIAGIVDTDPFVVTSGRCIATVRGDGLPWCATFRTGETPRLSTPVLATSLWLPAAGTDGALVEIPDGEAALINQEARAGMTAPSQALAEHVITIGDKSSVIFNLDGSAVTLRRCENLLNLTFRFEGFRLKIDDERAVVQRRTVDNGANFVAARITVELPPQHVAETILDIDGGCGQGQGPGGQCAVQPAPGTGCPSPIASRARLADPSRIVFDLPPQASAGAQWKERDLAVEQLTDWEGLVMTVDRRARAAVGDDYASQLRMLGIQDPAQAPGLQGIMQLVAANLVPPGSNVTALELARKLVFSPSEAARWQTTRTPRGDTGVPIFGLRIGAVTDPKFGPMPDGGDPRLRAIWSHLLPRGTFPTRTELGELLCTAVADLRPLTRKDHWNIVGQTSVYGLPALRRDLADPNEAAPRADPVEGALRRVPRGGVVRPVLPGGRDVPYLRDADAMLPTAPAKETGIALATTFETADVTLTALGATMKLDWRGEPAILKPSPPNQDSRQYPSGFTLERLSYETWLGRDVRVIAVTKGFLVPFGTRAALFKVAERSFLPGPGGRPVAQEIIRQFIVAPKSPKNFPAINQPASGRDFPAGSVAILSEQTPNLVCPDTVAGGRILVDAYPDLLAFWPKVRAPDGSVIDFEWKSSVDGDATPLRNAMIWVDSLGAATEDFIAKVIDSYNDGLRSRDPGRRAAWPERNIALLGGARRRYAPPADDIDTAFDTESWLLVARGRSNGLDPETGKELRDNFVMDARMNGADQPPFYPSLRRANLAVQSIDRLVGQPQGMIETQYFSKFVSDGFRGSNEDGQIFLEVIHPVIALDTSNRGEVSGGVAKPKTAVAALSRRSGVVGGKAPGAGGALIRTGSSEAICDFTKAASGDFDPLEFFDGKLRILGVDLVRLVFSDNVKLKDAPRLREVINYGAAGSNEALGLIKTAAAAAVRLLEGPPGGSGLFDQVDTAIIQFNASLAAHGITFDELYPDLVRAYREERRPIIQSLQGIADATGLGEVPSRIAALNQHGQPLLREIRRVADDPVPPQVDAAITLILRAWEALETAISDLPGRITREALAAVQAKLAELQQLGVAELELLFGLGTGETLADLLDSPEAQRRLAGTLFYEQLGEPVLRMLRKLREFEAEIGGRIRVLRETMLVAAAEQVDRALAQLADRLIEEAADQHNVLRPSDAEALGREIAEAAFAGFERAAAGATTLAQVEALKRAIHDSGSTTIAGIRAEVERAIAARQDWFHPLDPADLPAVLAAFRTMVAVAVTEAVIEAAKPRIDQAIETLRAVYNREVGRLVERGLAALINVIDAAERLARVAEISRLGRRLQDWCEDQARGVLSALQALGDKVLGSARAIVDAVSGVAAEASAIRLPATTPGPVSARFDTIRGSLLRAAAVLSTLAGDLETQRSILRQATTADTCTSTAAFAALFGKAVAARGRAAEALREVIAELAELERLVEQAPQDVAQAIEAELLRMTAHARRLVLDVTIAGKAGLAGDWREVDAAVTRLRTGISVQAYHDDLQRTSGALTTAAEAIRRDLTAASAAVMLRLFTEVEKLAADDRALAGLIAQSVALADQAQVSAERIALGLVKAVADPLATVHELAAPRLRALVRAAGTNEIIVYLLGGTGYGQLTADVGKVEADAVKLRALAGAGSLAAAMTAWRDVMQGWQPTPPLPSSAPPRPNLVRVIGSLVEFIQATLQGRFGELAAEAVRALLRDVRARIEQVIAQAVPVSITTAYQWRTPLKDNDVFKMTGGLSADNLKIDTRIHFNFRTQERSVTVEGELRPFQIAVAGFFTIFFDKTTFKSVNGSSPDFNAPVKDVQLGGQLEFIKKLQGLMAPSDSGFYIRPGFDGIRVGYAFSTGLVQVGSLQFINIALDVFADLPFSDREAIFGFDFASRDRPFLISNPPYGGGGWVSIRVPADGAMRIAMSFMFGAVTELKFGPLTGHGRICAGIWFDSGQKLITAFVEAVGEGNIGCFSIGIYIRISLTHNTATGAMNGEASYTYKFKIGFAEFRYNVTARYTVRGGGENQRASLSSPTRYASLVDRSGSVLSDASPGLFDYLLPADAATPRHESLVAPKSSQWKQFSQYFDMELLRG